MTGLFNSVISSILNSIAHDTPGAATPTLTTTSAPTTEPPSSPSPTSSPILPPISSSEPGAPATTSVITPSPVGSSDDSSPASTVTTLSPSQEFSPLSTSNGGGSEPTSIEGADSSTSSQIPQFTVPVSSSATISETGETSQLLTPGPLPASTTAASLTSSGLGAPVSGGSSTSVIQSEHQPGQSKGSSSPKRLVGTVVGSVVGTGMMILVIVLLFKWRRRRRRGRFSSASNRASCSTLSTWMDQSDFGDHIPAAALLRDTPERFTTVSAESNSTLGQVRSISEKWRTDPTGFHVFTADPVPAAMKECTTTRWQGLPFAYSRDHDVLTPLPSHHDIY